MLIIYASLLIGMLQSQETTKFSGWKHQFTWTDSFSSPENLLAIITLQFFFCIWDCVKQNVFIILTKTFCKPVNQRGSVPGQLVCVNTAAEPVEQGSITCQARACAVFLETPCPGLSGCIRAEDAKCGPRVTHRVQMSDRMFLHLCQPSGGLLGSPGPV